MGQWLRTTSTEGNQYLINLDTISAVKYEPEDKTVKNLESRAKVCYFVSGCDFVFIAEEFDCNEAALARFNDISKFLNNPKTRGDTTLTD